MLINWLKAFRLRTLPLSLSTVIMGNAIAISAQSFKLSIFVMTIVTTLLLQILSNLANDYGDGIKGTDNANRLGPLRAIQSGEISPNQMKKGVLILSILSLISGVYLVFFTSNISLSINILFFILGIGAISAAIKYTMGKNAYGYLGLGDVFVFIFFGLVGVIGSAYLQTQSLTLITFLPAVAIGSLSSAVLNLNNMRDIKNDSEMNKNTLVVKLGLEKAKLYHYSLFIVTYISLFLFIINISGGNHLKVSLAITTLFLFIFHIIHLIKVNSAVDYKSFDPELKKIALSCLFLSFSWLVSFIYF